MQWGNIELHVENLFPGFLICALGMILTANCSWAQIEIPEENDLLRNAFSHTAIFLSAAYVVGVLASAVSRLIIDKVADCSFTPLFFRFIAGLKVEHTGNSASGRFRRLRHLWWLRGELLQCYEDKLAEVVAGNETALQREVLRRRERARIVRNTFIPLAMIIWTIMSANPSSSSARSCLLSFSISLSIILVLFAYSETIILQECMKAASRATSEKP